MGRRTQNCQFSASHPFVHYMKCPRGGQTAFVVVTHTHTLPSWKRRDPTFFSFGVLWEPIGKTDVWISNSAVDSLSVSKSSSPTGSLPSDREHGSNNEARVARKRYNFEGLEGNRPRVYFCVHLVYYFRSSATRNEFKNDRFGLHKQNSMRAT